MAKEALFQILQFEEKNQMEANSDSEDGVLHIISINDMQLGINSF